MNYAEDRLDRKARQGVADSSSGLLADWNLAIDMLDAGEEGHELLAKTLRDVGACRHAVFHFAMAWMHSPFSAKAAGDYAQMAEFTGFPEIGVLALLHYRIGGQLKVPSKQARTNIITRQPHPLNIRRAADCGCGFAECGRRLCFIPMIDSKLIIEAIQEYVTQSSTGLKQMPTAYDILSKQAKKEQISLPHKSSISLLDFWNRHENYRVLDPVLQLILIKLLYVTVPMLSMEAVLHIQFDNPRQLEKQFKSHWAYYVLIRAVTWGERIKPSRRLQVPYPVPVWDTVFELDRRRDGNGNKVILDNRHAAIYHHDNYARDHFEKCLATCNQHFTCRSDAVLPEPMCCLPPMATGLKPLFIVGDSHVLSVAWQTIHVPSPRLAVPVVTTGLKAWHTKPDTRFFTHYLLKTSLERLPSSCKTIVFSAGEIDCREGIGGSQLEGYSSNCRDVLLQTVSDYVQALVELSQTYNVQILVMPVAPHAYRSQKNGKRVGRAFRRQAMQTWNQQLGEQLPRDKVYFLDYDQHLRQPGADEYVLDRAFNADYTHMNSAFLTFLEKAVEQCGCDLKLL